MPPVFSESEYFDWYPTSFDVARFGRVQTDGNVPQGPGRLFERLGTTLAVKTKP